MGDKIDPVEVNKNPQLIRDAQAEIGKLDVLVCGECHSVFHYIDQFQEHKLLGKCPRESTILESCANEQKPQVWAFMLWKNAKFKNAPSSEGVPSSWSVYQLWCNLDNSQKEAWVTAGRNIQSFTKLSTAKVQEVKTKIQTLQSKSPHSNTKKTLPKADVSKEEEEAEDDPLEEGEIRFSQLSEAQRRAIKSHREQTAAAAAKEDADPLGDSDSELDTEDEVEREAALDKLRQEKKDGKLKSVAKKPLGKPIQLSSDTILSTKKNGTSKRALRTLDDRKEEHTIEKIVSRRYNPGKKTFEYLIKWENCDDGENSWEPAVHLEGCKLLLEQFEVTLKKQKAMKLAQKAAEKKLEKKQERNNSFEEIPLTAGGRPQRTSKQKALNQVKAWCGSISDADEPSGKRSYSDSDSDSIEKKMKLELDTSDSEDDSTPIKKLKASLNGVGKKQPLPDNILVPDSQGIVRINQKQLPALSSGVYVMSKTAGIIKLDSNTSKIATSGGNAIIRVAPKIGQTSIKVIKKDSINGSKSFMNNPGRVKMPTKMYSPKIIKKTPPALLKKQEAPAATFASPKDNEESDDGVEELEFPTDLPLPPPDSPPREFTLCPLTGKIVGQDYPEETEAKPAAESSASNNENISLDNIVQLAAADILQDKEGNGEQPTSAKEAEVTPNETAAEKKISEKEGKAEPEPSTSSILSTALSNANIEPTAEVVQTPAKKEPVIITTQSQPQQQVKQKTEMTRNIINRTIVPKPAPQAIITRITPGPNHRNRPFVQKQQPVTSQFQQQSSLIRKPSVQSYSNRNTVRKVQQTTNTQVYQTSIDLPEVTPPKVAKTTIKPTNNVINMPLLTEPEPQPMEEIQEPVAVSAETRDLNTISISENEAPLLITGEDGTIYQVAGENEEGQTILITQDADGQQQCLLVASENAAELSQAVAAASAPIAEAPAEEPLVLGTEQEGETEMETDNAEDSQVVAQIVSAQPPSPGGTRKVVLMLPDGNLMMTEVTAEQYAALELDK